MNFKHYYTPKDNPFACRVDILFNKGKYIEFAVNSPKKYVRELRLLFGPRVQTYGNSGFCAGKEMIPRVLKALEIKGYGYRVTEDWI